LRGAPSAIRKVKSMNRLKGRIKNLESSEMMSIVEVDVDGDIFSAVVLETPGSAAYLKEGKPIDIVFKETEVSIGKGLTGMISLRNRIKAKIKSIERGSLMSKIILDYKQRDIVSVITTGSVQRLRLQAGDEVEWLVKTNEVALITG